MNNKEERFKKLIGEQKDRILSVCRYFTKNQADQQDLLQEIMINTWNGLDSFRGESQAGTWMYRIALNTALGFAGKTKRRMQIGISLCETNLHHLAEDYNNSIKEKLLTEMENQINQLSVVDKILITLMLEELSYREIAEIVGITEPNVRVKIHRIKNLLRNNMKGESYENQFK